MEQLLLGLGDALAPKAVLFVFLGVLLGYVIGVLPGLNRPAALAIAIPLSYYMTPLTAVAFLIGIAKASGAGGATTAVLINVPGEPNAVVTCLDGYPLARKGKAKLALQTALYGSVIGDVIGTLALIVLARPLAHFALGIGPVEMTALMLLALTFIAALAGASLLRGLAAGILGVFVATIGLDIESGTPRMTFGYTELMDGIPLLAVTIGMLALSEMVIQAEELFSRAPTDTVMVRTGAKDESFGWQTLRRLYPTFLSSSIVGTAIGLIPGLGPSVASFASYGLAKHFARPGEEFGKGELKGVAAAETADNAVVPASFVPLFALGLPGSVSAAILIGALTIHGLTPGPRLFDEHPRLIYGIFGTMIVAAILMLIVGRIGLVAFAKLTRVPATVIIPVVVMLCIVGSYLETRSVFAVVLMIGFAALGYLMHRFDYSRVTFLIGFVIGPQFELSLRQSLILTDRDPAALLAHPFAIAILAVALVVSVLVIRARSVPRFEGDNA
ncbi:tripartite tricarboxylate transporter permease [Bradyrhizobium sp. LHD-71]|uniref:tripartite tricarboxylate transporter permease n=1 Tax=Bradyrhizobium sp. LHD-71 TaxID=3072141 RepID=UPI00280D5202|nr:tripartite tricarboxylate transporter permease [Bradyrhizobium sp. LHD-71]MDQ8726865.1 tripartite tricarboxylate transporter permease [Bradyrhizobium sp. LHD-71]